MGDTELDSLDDSGPPPKNHCLNPITKQWDYLSPLEWRRLKAGYAKDHPISRLVLAYKESKREYIIAAFNLHTLHNGGLIAWLETLLAKWPNFTGVAKIENWPAFVQMYYPLAELSPQLEVAHKLRIEILKGTLNTFKVQSEITTLKTKHKKESRKQHAKRTRLN